MKQKTNKILKKKFKMSNPKHGKGKVLFETPGFRHNAGKKRKFRQFRGKIGGEITNASQAKKISTALS